MKTVFKKLFTINLLSLTLLLAFNASAQDDGDALLGVWEPSNGKARVKIDKIGDKYFGRIVWLKEPKDPNTGEAKVDKNNPDESLRSTPVRGYRMLKDFVFKGDGVWEEGTIYDPENGNNYSCIIKLKDEAEMRN